MKTTAKNPSPVTFPCRVGDCLAGPFSTPQGASLHFHRVHSGKVKVLGQKTGPAPGTEKTYVTAPAPSPIKKEKFLEGFNSNGHPVLLEAPSRKTVTKRKPIEVEIFCCPVDGTDLKTIAMELVLQGIRSGVNYCPKCYVNIPKLAAAMAAKTTNQKK